MLVSEIGYFQIRKNGLNDYSVAAQAQKSSMAEGFGHYNGINNGTKNEKISDKNFVKHIGSFLKSAFSNEKHEDKKSVSYIA